MSQFKIIITGKNLRADSIQKKAQYMISGVEGATVIVTKIEKVESRSDRFNQCLSMINDARCETESLRDELQDWYDNLPENFQNGDKGSQLQDSISELENFMSGCEDLENVSVEFPSMF